MWRVSFLVVAVGCAEAPDPPSTYAPMSFVEDNGYITRVSGPGYTVDYAVDGIRLPAQITAGSDRLLASGQCPEESQLGVGIYPVQTAAAGIAGAADSLGAFASIEGSAIISVDSTYAVDYSCGSAQQLAGNSTFYYYPSGRIWRSENLSPVTSTISSGNSCAQCGGSPTTIDTLFVTSWYAFDTSSLVDENDQPLAPTAQPERACAQFGDHLVGVVWDTTAATTRIKELAGGATGYLLDLVAPDSPSVTPAQFSMNSQLVIGAAGMTCRDVLALAVDPDIRRGGTVLPTQLGAYDAGVYIAGEPIVLTAMTTTHPGFAIFVTELDLANFTHMQVTIDGRRAKFAAQRGDNATAFFWFDETLEAGQTLTIEPD